ncbi:MAG: YigZ family protein [Clostridia bacterium]|nr:YigZ family protein [Clostridia bacterium]
MKKDYRTIKRSGRDELIEKKSRFIATVRPVTTEAEALSLIQDMRKEFSDANHNVYAYIVRENNIARYSDDGEPGGTAGMPVMEVLKQEDLTDVAVVVTRYFGGTKLGAGGLVRAYSKATKMGIDKGIISIMTDCTLLQITVQYDQYNRLQYLLEQEGLTIEDATFGQDVAATVCIRTQDLEDLQKKIIESTNGSAACSVLFSEYRPLAI